jgi:hypothetical protein
MEKNYIRYNLLSLPKIVQRINNVEGQHFIRLLFVRNLLMYTQLNLECHSAKNTMV